MKITIKRFWRQNRLVPLDDLSGYAFTGESGAHVFEITGLDASGHTVPISGTLSGKFINADGVTVPLTTGGITDGVASVPLIANCYNVPGRFILTLFTTEGGVTTCIYYGVGTVMRSQGNSVPYPSATIPDIAALIDSIPTDYTALSQRALQATTTNITLDNRAEVCNADCDQLATNRIYGVYADAALAHEPFVNTYYQIMTVDKATTPSSCNLQLAWDSGLRMRFRIGLGANAQNGWTDWITIWNDITGAPLFTSYTEELSSASQWFYGGELVMINGQLYRVTEAVPEGGSFADRIESVNVDSLFRDVIRHSAQTLTAAQQYQARANIDAASDTDLQDLSTLVTTKLPGLPYEGGQIVDGTYHLTCTVTNGTPRYSWVRA